MTPTETNLQRFDDQAPLIVATARELGCDAEDLAEWAWQSAMEDYESAR